MKASLKSGSIALVTLAAAGLLYGTVQTTGDAHHVSIVPTVDLPAGPDCLWVTAEATPEALATFHLQSDAGSRYVLGHFCPEPVDGGDEAAPPLPAGMFPLSVADRQDAYDGGPVIEVWTQDGPDVPWDCACSPGSGCYVTGEDGGTREAPVGSTLAAGWSGVCVRKSCSTFATSDGSDPTWPAGCPR